eukprot:CAMPEP_0176260992 /NCGR_PEP_ID=MMETSP0121_2-20121125/39867_1 /TAXON_ID=160619 /ORGANISM="Kryptoperidinium foliaceum, Strain CCMP 1326" /LENGTH=321 /DNA_ID=CAMNT_0017600917 /DNA_START=9 /DNA_END=970 /DNA_ORIENTATION=-
MTEEAPPAGEVLLETRVLDPLLPLDRSPPPSVDVVSPRSMLRGGEAPQSPSLALSPQGVPEAVAAVAAAAAALFSATSRSPPPSWARSSPLGSKAALEDIRRKQEQALAILEAERTQLVQSRERQEAEAEAAAAAAAKGEAAQESVCSLPHLETSMQSLEDEVYACRRQPPSTLSGFGGETRLDDLRFPEVSQDLPLLRQARELREQLSAAEERLQTLTAEAAAQSGSMLARQSQHQQWAQKLKDEASTLRRDNLRLEGSMQMASADETKATDALREQPRREQEALGRLRDECRRLEEENAGLEFQVHAGRAELSALRAAG